MFCVFSKVSIESRAVVTGRVRAKEVWLGSIMDRFRVRMGPVRLLVKGLWGPRVLKVGWRLRIFELDGIDGLVNIRNLTGGNRKSCYRSE
ncbi:hypothetical protein TSUD_263250 [Trifolium subterraneum]|uniref:Uncharacterized protein n=1 Tax=Trifolium subterraneum TaxID=3900 RepID=A0A2Z6NUC8_TRISU|nr:hypothetical protein TSUD_263250 [Trifolium subterraneum]